MLTGRARLNIFDVNENNILQIMTEYLHFIDTILLTWEETKWNPK